MYSQKKKKKRAHIKQTEKKLFYSKEQTANKRKQIHTEYVDFSTFSDFFFLLLFCAVYYFVFVPLFKRNDIKLPGKSFEQMTTHRQQQQ